MKEKKNEVPIGDQFNRVMQSIFSPSKAFQELDNKPAWLIAFLIIGTGTFLISYFTSPYIVQAGISDLPSNINSEHYENIVKLLQRSQFVGLALSPLFMFLKLLINALILWLVTNLFTELKFKKLFSLVVHCGIITFLRAILSYIILRLRGLQSIKSPADLQVFLGLDMFTRNQELSLPLKVFLNNINVFSLWWIWLLGLGLSIFTKISRKKTLMIVVFIWLFGTILQVGIASLMAPFK